MNHFVAFWESLGYSKSLFLLLVVFFLFHLVFMLWKLMVLKSGRNRMAKETEEGVSVIITCSNKAELLEQNLEAFLNQDYPCFEVIVVDECSEDDTKDVLAKFQERYPNLKTSRISSDTKFRRTKKIAINIGILAAQYDVLLFSEIHCRPATPHWIRLMQAAFSERTAVVIGFANYESEVGRDMRRYFRFQRFWQAMLLLRMGMNVVGNGYNMGYRKAYYLEERGFSMNTQEYIGYDTEMVKKLSTRGRVEVVKDVDSFMLIADDSDRVWADDNSYYYATKRRWPWQAVAWSNVDFVIKALFYGLSFYFLYASPFRLYFGIALVLMYAYDLIIINAGVKKLSQTKLFVSSLRSNTCGFIYDWCYYVYSVFTGKKWR